MNFDNMTAEELNAYQRKLQQAEMVRLNKIAEANAKGDRQAYEAAKKEIATVRNFVSPRKLTVKSELILQLESLPAFAGLKKGLEQNLRAGNFYVDSFMPESEGYYDEKDDNGKQVTYPYHLSQDQREDEAIDLLLDNQGDEFDEFIHDDNIRHDVTELMRAIIKEYRKCQ